MARRSKTVSDADRHRYRFFLLSPCHCYLQDLALEAPVSENESGIVRTCSCALSGDGSAGIVSATASENPRKRIWWDCGPGVSRVHDRVKGCATVMNRMSSYCSCCSLRRSLTGRVPQTLPQQQEERVVPAWADSSSARASLRSMHPCRYW